MSAVLISYDLNNPGQKYEKVIEAIKSLGDWIHILQSTWIVSTSLTSDAVRDKVKAQADDNDLILVVSITGDSYSGWLPQKSWDWLKKHV